MVSPFTPGGTHRRPPQGNIDICPKGQNTSPTPIRHGCLSISPRGQVLDRNGFAAHIPGSIAGDGRCESENCVNLVS